MKKPLISIITPAHKAEKTIIRAIQSVFAQDFPDWEMIIISDDHQNYYQFLKDNHIMDERLKFTSTGKIKSGAGNARNKGLEIAEGNYIVALDADDAFKPQKLSTMIPLVGKYGAALSNMELRHTNSGILLCEYLLQLNVFQNIPWIGYRGTEVTPKDIAWVFYTIYMYDRTVIQDLWYDNDLTSMEDYVFLMSFFNDIEKIGFETNPLHIYYKRDHSSSQATDSYKNLIKAKKDILAKLETGNISIKNELAKQEAKKFVELSLQLEDVYRQEYLKNPQITFLEILNDNLHQLL